MENSKDVTDMEKEKDQIQDVPVNMAAKRPSSPEDLLDQPVKKAKLSEEDEEQKDSSEDSGNDGEDNTEVKTAKEEEASKMDVCRAEEEKDGSKVQETDKGSGEKHMEERGSEEDGGKSDNLRDIKETEDVTEDKVKTAITDEKNKNKEEGNSEQECMNGKQTASVDSTKEKSSDIPTDMSIKQTEDKPLSLSKCKNDDSSVNSEDSEKENLNSDMPMDLSTKSSGSGNPPDVIMLSDDSDDDGVKLNGDKDLSLDELKLRRKFIKRLQAELRNEEAKLVLLKKLRQSQLSHQLQEQNNIVSNNNNSTNNSSKMSSAPSRQQTQHQSQPPPLIRGSQQQIQARPAHSQPPQMMRGNQSSSNHKQQSQGPPPLVMAPRVDGRHMMQNHMRGMVHGNSANLIPGFRGNQSVSHLQQAQQAAQQRVVEETPAQRQAAAKLALRKQLEKTLLQIPPPKPPPPEMNFIPSLASPDFIYLLGLEEAVNFIIDANLISKGRKNPDEKMVCNPFTCVQCGSDFTPVWKREKPGSKHVICEQCVTSNQKKALKQEHTNRLKSAFVKALQQEQEIERMQSQETKATPPAQPPAPVTTTSSHSSSSSAMASSYKQQASIAAETLRQHQNLLHAHQAASLRMGQPLGLQAFNPRNPFPYQLPFGARPSDLQRQYLLDMIPKGGLPWNS